MASVTPIAPELSAKRSRIVVIGDSIVRGYQGGTTPVYPWPTLLGYLKPSLQVVNKGVDGNTLANVRDRLMTDVIGQKAGVAIVAVGTNDFVTGGTPSTMSPTIVQITETLLRYGVFPIWTTILPRSDQSAAMLAVLRRINRMIEEHAKTYGIGFVDTYSTFCNADGSVKAGYISDNRHPTEFGYWSLAKTISTAISTIVPTFSSLPYLLAGETNIAPNGDFTAGAGGLATSWSTAKSASIATLTPTLVANPSGGQYQQIARSAGSVIGDLASFMTDYLLLSTYGLVVGDQIEVACDLDTDGVSLNGDYLRVRLQWVDAANGAAAPESSIVDQLYSPVQGIRVSAKYTIPAGTVKIRPVFSIYGAAAATARVGRFTVVKR